MEYIKIRVNLLVRSVETYNYNILIESLDSGKRSMVGFSLKSTGSTSNLINSFYDIFWPRGKKRQKGVCKWFKDL